MMMMMMIIIMIIIIIISLVSPTHADTLTHVLVMNCRVWKPVGFALIGVGFRGQPLTRHDISV
jgi:hypothetical protein